MAIAFAAMPAMVTAFHHGDATRPRVEIRRHGLHASPGERDRSSLEREQRYTAMYVP